MSAHSAPQSSRSNEQPEDAGRIQSDHAGHHTPAADDRPVSGGAAGSTLHRIAGPMLIGLGLAGLLSLMLPIAKALGESVGWFDYDETSGEGTLLIVSFAVVIAVGIVGLLLVVAGIMLFIPGKTGDSRRRAATTERVS